MRETQVLVIGAGPFGLSLAAHAKHLGIDHLIVGEPMAAWRNNMPQGMILRSHADWHLDAAELHTIERFCDERGVTVAAVEPLSRDFYLEYVDWFIENTAIAPIDQRVRRLDYRGGAFEAELEDGHAIRAAKVVLAVGFGSFKNIPARLSAMLPADRLSHTCDLVEFDRFRDKRCLIVGGRQSAFEWTALLVEHGAQEVHVSHRHPTPAFEDSEWEWIDAVVTRFVEEPNWYRDLTGDGQARIHERFAEAKIKLEPWLWPRIDKPNVHLWPETELQSATEHGDGLRVELDNGPRLTVDHVILATGYRVDMRNLAMLSPDLQAALTVKDGFPVLDSQLQSSIPGMFITSLPASGDFGPFFGFTVAVKASAKIITKALLK